MIHLHWLPICPLLIRQPDTQRLLPILQCSKTMTHSCLSKILTDAAVNEVALLDAMQQLWYCMVYLYDNTINYQK